MAETIGALLLAGLTVETAAGASAVAALTIGSTSITVGAVVGSAALLGASIAISYATQPKVPPAGEVGGSTPIRQATPPRPFGYGRARLAGAYMLFETSADGQDSWDVIAIHHGRIGAIVHYMLNDDIVELDGDGWVVALLNGSDSGYGWGRYDTVHEDNVRIKSRLGLATETAYAEVAAALPTLWTSAHRGDGVASLMLHCVDEPTSSLHEVYPRGLPKPSVVADLSPIWDPRDEAQDRDDPDTWEVSANPVLQLIDYLTHADRGPGLDYETLIEPVIDLWMDEADICDEATLKADGSSEARYASNGWALLTTDPAEVIGAILAACDGWLAEAGDGTLRLVVGKYRAPSVTLTDDHIIGFTIHKGVADEEIANEVQFTYTAPQANYRDEPGVSVQDETVIADMGVVRSERLELTWVQSHSQGRRLAKRKLARNLAMRGQLVTGLYGLTALAHRWVGVQSTEIDDLANAVIEVTRARVDLASATVTLEWMLVNPNEIDAWDPATEEGTPPNYFPVPANVTAQDHGAGNQIRVDMDANNPATPWLYWIVEYRLGSGAWTRETFDGGDLVDIGGGRRRLTTAAVAAGTYSVRIASTGPPVVVPGSPPVVYDPDLVWSPSVGGITGVVIS